MAEHPLLYVEITFMRKVNWSLLAAGIPVVWKLDIRNGSSKSLEPMELKLWIGSKSDLYVDSGPHHLPEIPADSSHSVEIHSLSWRRDFKKAMRLTKPQQSHLHLRLGSYHGSCLIDLLTPNEWCIAVACLEHTSGQITFVRDSTVELTKAAFKLPVGAKKLYQDRKDDIEEKWVESPPIEIAVAAFVFPRHEKILGLVRTANTMLKAVRGSASVSIDEVVSGGPSGRLELVKTLPAAMAQLYPHLFHTIEDVSFESRSQRIRSFDEALAIDPQKGQRLTCIEAALILCSLMINVGLSPLLILMGMGINRAHAFVGTWLEEPEDDGVLYRDVEELRQWVADGKLLIIDVTPFLLRKLNFEQACKEGETSLWYDDFIYALNIGKAWDVYKFKPLSELAEEQVRISRRKILYRLAAGAIAAGIPLALYIWLPNPCRTLATLTHVNDKPIALHQAEVIVGERVAEVALRGEIKENACQDFKVFTAINEDGSLELQGPAERIDDNWLNRVLLRLPPGSDTASFDLIPLIATKDLKQDEARSALQEQQQQGSHAVTVIMKLASLTIENPQAVGAHAELHGVAKNLPNRTVVVVETKGNVDGMPVSWTPRGKTEVNEGNWNVGLVPMRDSNDRGGQVDVRVKLSSEEKNVYASDKVISKSESLKVADPYVKITLVDGKEVRGKGLGPELVPDKPVKVEGVAGNLLRDDTIWLRILERGLNGTVTQILPETGADIIARQPDNNESVRWFKSVPIGSGVKFTIKAGVCSNPPINEEDFVGFSGISDTVECGSRR